MGPLASGIAAVAGGSGRLDLFARNPAGELIHRWYADERWSDWESLHGLVSSTPAAGWAGSTLIVAAIGANHAVWRRSWNGQEWSPWENLGGQIVSAPSVAGRANGEGFIFGTGVDGALWSRHFSGAEWEPWTPLGGRVVGTPASITDHQGAVHVFCIGTDAEIWHLTLAPGATTTPIWAKVAQGNPEAWKATLCRPP
jgi:hypothetical protein